MPEGRNMEMPVAKQVLSALLTLVVVLEPLSRHQPDLARAMLVLAADYLVHRTLLTLILLAEATRLLQASQQAGEAFSATRIKRLVYLVARLALVSQVEACLELLELLLAPPLGSAHSSRSKALRASERAVEEAFLVRRTINQRPRFLLATRLHQRLLLVALVVSVLILLALLVESSGQIINLRMQLKAEEVSSATIIHSSNLHRTACLASRIKVSPKTLALLRLVRINHNNKSRVDSSETQPQILGQVCSEEDKATSNKTLEQVSSAVVTQVTLGGYLAASLLPRLLTSLVAEIQILEILRGQEVCLVA